MRKRTPAELRYSTWDGDCMFNETVTAFNYFKDTNGIKYYPTVLHNVRLQIIKGANISKTGLQNADTAKLFINDIEKFKKPKAWLSDKTNNFTFNPGKCFFAFGEFSESIVSDSTYTGGFFNHMVSTYDDVYKVTNCDVYNVIPHLEVGGV